jgi:hypothetical protein
VIGVTDGHEVLVFQLKGKDCSVVQKATFAGVGSLSRIEMAGSVLLGHYEVQGQSFLQYMQVRFDEIDHFSEMSES